MSIGKDCYDQRKEKKLRCPAWCDRVLWRIGKNSASAAEPFDNDTDDESGSEDGGNGGQSDSVGGGSTTAGGSITKSVVSVPELAPTQSALEVELNLDSELTGMTGLNLGSNADSMMPPSPLTVDETSFKAGSFKQSGGEQSEKSEKSSEKSSFDKRVPLSGKESKGSELLLDCQENIELMLYDRCSNTISDHKPVRAILNMKVKR